MSQALRDFQDLCQDYLYLEQLSGVSPGPTYPPQYPTTGTAPEEAAQDVASFERNRLGPRRRTDTAPAGRRLSRT